MLVERITWLVAVALVGAAAFYGGQQLGFASGQQSRAEATQRFLAQRGGQSAGLAGQGGQPAAGGQGGRFGGQSVAGVVETVDGDRVSIATSDGSIVTVRLAADGTVRRMVDGSVADLKSGERVVAFGAPTGDVFEATSLQIGGGRPGP